MYSMKGGGWSFTYKHLNLLAVVLEVCALVSLPLYRLKCWMKTAQVPG